MTTPDEIDPEPPAPHRIVAAPSDHEHHVLACCFIDRGLIPRLIPGHFSDPHNRSLAHALQHCDQQGIPPTLDALVPALTRQQLQDIGGLPTLLALTDPLRYSTTADFEYHLGQLAIASENQAARRLAERILESPNPAEVLSSYSPQVAASQKSTLLARPFDAFQIQSTSHDDTLIGRRWLCRGDIGILSSTSGMGKSSLGFQLACHWALAMAPFDAFHPNGPQPSLFIQSEDSDGDVAEMRHSIYRGMNLTPNQQATCSSRVHVITDRVNRGPAFISALRAFLTAQRAKGIVYRIIWINPLLAFAGCDINDAEEVGNFVRGGLNGLNEPGALGDNPGPEHAYMLIHHTAKPPKERAERRWNEVMYAMAGSADLTNAARAILALEAQDEPGHFNLIGAKRGTRAGMTVEVPGKTNPDLTFKQSTDRIGLRWSTERFTPPGGEEMPMIYWKVGPAAAPEERAKAGRKPAYDHTLMLSCVPGPQDKPESVGAIHRKVEQLPCGISLRQFRDVVAKWCETGEVKRTGNARVGFGFQRAVE